MVAISLDDMAQYVGQVKPIGGAGSQVQLPEHICTYLPADFFNLRAVTGSVGISNSPTTMLQFYHDVILNRKLKSLSSPVNYIQ